jgi:hypothetical protein
MTDTAMIFEGDDRGYLKWISLHQQGYVLNLRSDRADAAYVVLHRADCPRISTNQHLSGAYTERKYRKACASTVSALIEVARREGRSDGTFSKRCRICKPL